MIRWTWWGRIWRPLVLCLVRWAYRRGMINRGEAAGWWLEIVEPSLVRRAQIIGAAEFRGFLRGIAKRNEDGS